MRIGLPLSPYVGDCVKCKLELSQQHPCSKYKHKMLRAVSHDVAQGRSTDTRQKPTKPS